MFNILIDIFRGMDAKSLMVGWLRLGFMLTTSNEVLEGSCKQKYGICWVNLTVLFIHWLCQIFLCDCVWECVRWSFGWTLGRPLHWLCLGFSISSACFPNSGARWELIIWLGNQGQAPLSLSSMTWPHQLTALPPPLQCRTYMCNAQESTCRQAGKEQDHTVYLRVCICVFVCDQTRCMYGRLWKSATALWVKN